MELTGSTLVSQPRERVWAALNDETILQQCITGCESMQRLDPHSLSAKLAIKLGPVRAKFNGQVVMSNIRPLEGYTLNFDGSGGAAGFAKGSSNVELSSVDGGTQISYTAQASVGGKLGQIGGRMIDAAARGMADDFFSAFAKALAPAEASPDAAKPQASISPTQPQASTPSAIVAPQPVAAAAAAVADNRMFWFCSGIACGAALLLIGKHFL
jgi:uncharacterized protein